MNVFQRIGNALSRFMYGRNGPDQLGLCMIWGLIILNVVNIFVRSGVVGAVLNVLTTILAVWIIYRMFSRNLYKRRAENAAFLNKVWYPVRRRFTDARTQARDREHKYFTCPNCHAVCRVPRGKGNIVITCPCCRHEIRGKS